MMASKFVKKNITQFDQCFASELNSPRANTAVCRGQILKYNETSVQVFCTSKRRIILSRDYFLVAGEPNNRNILAADIGNSFLSITLSQPSKSKQMTKFISLANNQDVGELDSSRVFTRVIEAEDLPKSAPNEVHLALIDTSNSVFLLVVFSQSRLSEKEL